MRRRADQPCAGPDPNIFIQNDTGKLRSGAHIHILQQNAVTDAGAVGHMNAAEQDRVLHLAGHDAAIADKAV